ncbi:endonuclease III domain-containing protein [Staphylococcus caeli]|uniref:endonuclease III domain-containing protein n=1 Tax=Staphylococcus caeli TaxID=2201815 RepID=UPI003F55FF00
MKLDTETLYQILQRHMGHQKWWPAESKIEIILGAILVQNTNWRNAAYAIETLKRETQLEPHHILNLKLEDLQLLIKSSGFYKSKSQTILALLTWLSQYDFNYEEIAATYGSNLRKELLSIKGIGSETADVLIVYIFDGVEFIPDSYTRRIYRLLGYEHTQQYDKLKRHITLPDHFTNQDANELHALLDNFGKNYFNGKASDRYTFLDEYFKKD